MEQHSTPYPSIYDFDVSSESSGATAGSHGHSQNHDSNPFRTGSNVSSCTWSDVGSIRSQHHHQSCAPGYPPQPSSLTNLDQAAHVQGNSWGGSVSKGHSPHSDLCQTRDATNSSNSSGSRSEGSNPFLAAAYQQQQVLYPDLSAGAAGGVYAVAGSAPQQPDALFPTIKLVDSQQPARAGHTNMHLQQPPAAAAAGPSFFPPPPQAGAAAARGGFLQGLTGLFGRNAATAPPSAPGLPARKPQPQLRPSPLQVAAARMPHRLVWCPRKAPRAVKRTFSPLALLLFMAFLVAAGYYFYIRVTYSIHMGSRTWYGVLVLVVEIIGLSAVVPYGFLLPFYTASTGSRGLPLDDGRVVLPPEKRFRVHILVPCYKESLEVITNTVTAALAAEVPPGVTRLLYLCDDGKDPSKAALIASIADAGARYVSGRTRAPGEINGKSANLNNCLKNVIFPEFVDQPENIPLRDVIVVFDADMAARRNFLLKVLEAMWDDSCSLVLTPQAFSNINPRADIFNNINQQFWEYVLPGCDFWGYIACTGTNFCLRARSLAQVGWFPEYTITEDYALSMELKSAGFKGRYLPEYLAVGEAPDEIRNVCRQRSRWTKGHMQIFFSRRCPLIQWKLPLIHKILYTNGTWAYFCTILTTIMFLLVPFNSLVFGYHPVAFSFEFALAATIYLPMNFLLMNYVRTPRHLKGLWMAQISNHILCFTYIKAVINTLLAIMGFKAKAGFKATDKSGGANPLTAIKNLGNNIVNTMTRAGSGPLPSTAPPLPATAAPGGPRVAPMVGGPARPAPVPTRVVIGPGGRPMARPLTKEQLLHAQVRQQQEAQKKKSRRGCWLWINAKTLEGALDPLFLAFNLCVSLAAIAAGIYSIIKSKSFDFSVNSWNDFTQVFTSGRVDVYILVPILWALYNAIPPLLFFVYFFTKGRFLQGLCSVMQVLGVLLAAAAVGTLWLGMLVPYKGIPGAAPISDITKSINNAIHTSLNKP